MAKRVEKKINKSSKKVSDRSVADKSNHSNTENDTKPFDIKDLNLPQRQSFVAKASLLRRFIAFLIDLIIINFVIVAPFAGYFKKYLPEANTFSETMELLESNPLILQKLSGLMILISIIVVLYFAVLEWKIGQSVGKAIMKIYVISVPETSGQVGSHEEHESTVSDSVESEEKVVIKQVSFVRSVIRNIYLIPFVPFVFLWFVEPFFILFTKNNQRLLEVLTRSMVVARYELD